jgi:hypothetical protein
MADECEKCGDNIATGYTVGDDGTPVMMVCTACGVELEAMGATVAPKSKRGWSKAITQRRTELRKQVNQVTKDDGVAVDDVPSLIDDLEPTAPDIETDEPVGEFMPKGAGQLKLDGTPVPVASIWIKPQAVPYEIRLAKFKLNTTEEGFTNRTNADEGDLRQWIAKKLKVYNGATILPGDFDKAMDMMVQVIRGDIEAPKHHVGEDDD